MKFTDYLKTVCPYCGGTKHTTIGTHRRGCITLRYHRCACGRTFVSRDRIRTRPSSR